MTRPRVVAVVSAIASSTATFFLLNRLNLAGTLPGAMVVPLVGTVVGHWSNEGLSCMGRWARRRLGKAEAIDTQASSVLSAAPGRPAAGRSVEGRRAAGRRAMGQWLLVGFAMTALAVSIYSLTVPAPMQTVVVKERVVQKTVTVTTAAEKEGQAALVSASTEGDTQAQGSGNTDVQTETTPTTATQAEQTPAEPVPTADPDLQGEIADQTAPASADEADPGSGATTPVPETTVDGSTPADDSIPTDGSVPVAGGDGASSDLQAR